MSSIALHGVRIRLVIQLLLLSILTISICPVSYSQQPSNSSQFGIFDSIADWGTDAFPPTIGKYKEPGRVEITSDDGLIYNLYGNGNEMLSNVDEGFYLYTTRSGSWSLSAKVEWVFNGRDMYVFVGARPKAGLHIRANPADNSSMDYWAYLRTGGYGPNYGETYSAWRHTQQAYSQDYKLLDENSNSIRDDGDGVFMRITRIAPENLFYTSWSPDGIQWEIVHQLSLIMPDEVAYGLSVTNADDNELLAQARFEQVRIEPAPTIATRYLSSHSYRPMDNIRMILSVLNPNESKQVVQLEESIPEGWKVITADFNPIQNETSLKWSFDAEPGYTQIHYTIQAPNSFAGMALLQGKIADNPIFGNNALLDSVTNLDTFRTHIFFRTVFLITPLVMGLIHLTLYIFLPRLKENLFYSLFLLGIATHIGLGTSRTTSLAELEIVWYQGAILAAFYISMLNLSLNTLVFNQSSAFFWWYFVTALTIAALVHTTGHLVFMVTHNIVYTVGIVNATRIAFLGLWRNKPGFSIIVLGMLLYNIAWWWLYIETAIHIIDPPFYILPFSMMAMIFSMSIYLSYWFAHLYRNLESLTGELEERVAARTHDITNANVKLNETVDQLAHAINDAKNANRAKSQFLARMSHEIRTPLTGMLGISEFLQNTQLNPQQSTLLNSLRTAGNSLLNVINEILDFSKIETDMLILNLSEMNLYETVRESVESLQALADNKFIYLQWSYADDLPNTVVGDPYRIRQILTNLTGNAIKFTEVGSVIVAISGTTMNDGRIMFEFKVEDTGIGISPEAQEQIFDAFSQGDETTTRRFGGTGLGLSIVKRIVDLMDGTIRVESVVDEGSTFFVQVPLIPLIDKDEPAEPEQPRKTVQFNARVLLAEDDPVISQVTQEMLHFYGCEYVHVTNGLDAVHAFQQQPFDLVLMDYHMPEMDGITAAAAIRQYEKDKGITHPTPMLAVTANISKEAHDKCIRAGLHTVLKKPFTMNELQAVLQEWAAGFRQDSEPEIPLDESVIDSTLEPSEQKHLFMDDPVFDPTPVSQIELIQQKGSNLVGKVIVKYMLDSEQTMLKLKLAVSAQNLQDIHLWAHRMVGSNVTIGGSRLAVICRHIEECNDFKQITEWFAIAEQEYQFLLDYLNERFEQEIETA